MKLKHLLLLFGILTLILGATGCIFSPDDGGGDDPPPVVKLPPAVTPDILMSNFRRTYEAMNSGDFEAMLHPDYRTILLQSTFDDWAQGDNPLTQMYFDHDAEVTIHRNIFEGLGGVDEQGRTIPPIDSITVTIMEKNGVWDDVEGSDVNFGGKNAYWAQYTLLMHFNKPDASRFEVNQIVDFFVVQGADELWYMLGQKGYPID